MSKYDELERLAKAATPGPWEPCLGSGNNECTALHYPGDEKNPYGLFVCDLLPDWIMDDKYEVDRSFKSANMDYIAAANPEAVLALLAERRRMVERLQQWAGPHPDHHVANGFCEYCWRSEHARDLLRELGEKL